MALLSTKTYQFIYLIFGSNLGKKNNNKTTFFFCHHSFCHHHYWCSFASFTGGGGRNRGTRSVEQQSSTCTISQDGHGDHSHVAGQNTVLSVQLRAGVPVSRGKVDISHKDQIKIRHYHVIVVKPMMIHTKLFL